MPFVLMEKLVPLISPTVAGPLGIIHLPRMWLKSTLASVDALYDAYVSDYRGLNKRVIDALGIDERAFFDYLRATSSYPDTERWIEAHAANLPSSIRAANSAVLELNSAAAIDLDDWNTMHDWLLSQGRAALQPIIPTISSSSAGPAGLRHFPRLWIKALLNALGALPEGYNSGCGFDAYVSTLCGLDLAEAVAFIQSELPSYARFEDWFRERVPGIAVAATLVEYNTAIVTRLKPEDKAAAERLEAGVPELSFRDVIMCNDMLDWKALHDDTLERRERHRHGIAGSVQGA
jgi:hypothetical protein